MGHQPIQHEEQKQMEDKVVDELKKLGYHATAASSLIDAKVVAGMADASAHNTMKDSSFGAILTIVLLDKQKEISTC